MTLPPALKLHLDAIGIRVVASPKPKPVVYAAPWKPTHKGEECPF